jgi:hypothetical protein
MPHTIKIPLHIDRDSYYDTNEKIEKQFGMPAATSVELTLTDELVAKMKRVQKFLINDDLTTIEFISSFAKDEIKSQAVFYKDDKPLSISTFSDWGKKWPTANLECFQISCSWFHSSKFQVRFLYTSADASEVALYSNYFDVQYFENKIEIDNETFFLK